jgi:uncharacterized membrane protein
MNRRDAILEWAEQGRLEQGRLRAALEAGGALPGADDWRGFLDRLLLWGAAAFLSVALAFFIAYNWEELGRWVRFALVEAAFVAALGGAWWLGLDRAAGKACLFAAAIVVGVMFALVGQTYQTGADPWELFALWAAAIVPFALAGRLPVLWLLVLALANLATVLYFQAFHGLFSIVFGRHQQLWIMFGLNAVALVAWEALAARGTPWMQERWSARIVATASGGIACALAVFDVFDRQLSGEGLLAWSLWCAAAYAWHRRRRKDLFVLAGVALSAIVVVTAALSRLMLDSRAEAVALFFIGNAVIGMSAFAGWWLRKVALEEGE